MVSGYRYPVAGSLLLAAHRAVLFRFIKMYRVCNGSDRNYLFLPDAFKNVLHKMSHIKCPALNAVRSDYK